MTLLQLFQSLDVPDRGIFNAVRIASNSSQRIARNDQGYPCLLLPCQSGQVGLSNIKLQNLKIYQRASCTITDGSQVNQEIFTLICFQNEDQLLQEYFLRVSEPIIASISDCPYDKDIADVIYRYIEIFRMLSEPPRKSVQGLWAELIVILESSDPTMMLEWWHINPGDRYDFESGLLKIEVKSTSGSERVHYFSQEQLLPSTGRVLIVSVLMRPSPTGISLEKLREMIAHKLRENILIQKLDLVIARTLGSSISDASDMTFDYGWAKNTMLCYPGETLPNIRVEAIPKGISDLRFKINLSSINIVSDSWKESFKRYFYLPTPL